MDKYFLFLKNSISESLVYRANVYMILASQAITLTIFIVLWTAIYQQGSSIGNYSFQEMVSYYVLVSFISFVIQGVDVAWRVGDDIRLGNITNFILRPVNYFWSVFFTLLGKSLFNLITIVIISVIFFLAKPLIFFNLFGNLKMDIFFAISLILAFIIFVLLFYMIGMIAFWMGTSQGINFLIRMIMFFLAGNIIPLDLLPQSLISINNFLPFQFITWFPIQIFSGQAKLEMMIFLPLVIWIIALYVIDTLIYNKGIEKYEGFGA